MGTINEKIEDAYRKLKSYAYFDKTNNILKDDIINFEIDCKGEDINKKIDRIERILKSSNNSDWIKFTKEIVDNIQIYNFPKRIRVNENNGDDLLYISNIFNDEHDINVEKQSFIKLNIEGHILGVLWVMTIGKVIDKEFFENSKGNRVMDEKKSPYLFKPYYNQYEKWRGDGLELAENLYDSGQDSIILKLDIEKFYYNVNFGKEMKEHIDKYVEEAGEQKNILDSNISKDDSLFILRKLNEFVFEVLNKYSEIFKQKEKKVILPIGFLPSFVLSNLYLHEFDRNLIERINPSYYGRYVDDIIIVDKVERKSILQEKLNMFKNNKEEFMSYYFEAIKDEVLLVKEFDFKCQRKGYGNNENPKEKYRILFKSNLYNKELSTLPLNSDKVKIYYFAKGGTKSLLDKVSEEIKSNTSEFRYLPEEEEIFFNSYNNIYSIDTGGKRINLNDIKSINVNKYELSKFISKKMTIGNLIEESKKGSFYKDIEKIFDKNTLIENYTQWENILTLCSINEKFDEYKKIYNLIKKSIKDIKDDDESIAQNISIKESLEEHLKVCIYKSLALVWGEKVNRLIKEIIKSKNNKDLIEEIHYKRVSYISARMINKYLVANLVDLYLIENKNFFKCYTKDDFKGNLNLTKLESSITKLPVVTLKEGDKDTFVDIIGYNLKKYKYYPYLINYQDISTAVLLLTIKTGKIVKEYDNSTKTWLAEKISSLYSNINFKEKVSDNNIEVKNFHERSCINDREIKNDNIFSNVISVRSDYENRVRKKNSESKMKIGIATARVEEKQIKGVFEDTPDRSLKRYNEIAEIINQAIKEKVDLLILPECYVPLEWISLLSREAKKGNMAIVTGMEHYKYKENVYNLTATILPYKIGDYTFAYTNYRTKVSYSPEEKRQINGYGLKYIDGKEFNMFVWNNIWMPIYCCHEITSLDYRSIFYGYPDLIGIVEYNRDTNYFENIIESLSRDMHCYCAQVNTSQYGDSCIIAPKKTVKQYLAKTKGGINNTILVEEIDIDELRKFQLMKYELQKDKGKFKPTPPKFNSKVARLKRENITFNEVLNGEKH